MIKVLNARCNHVALSDLSAGNIGWSPTEAGWVHRSYSWKKKRRSWWWLWKSCSSLDFPIKKTKNTSIEDVPMIFPMTSDDVPMCFFCRRLPAHGGRAFSHRSLHPCHVHQAEAAPTKQYTYPSEKYESQLGLLFPIWTLYCQTSPYGHYIDFVLWTVAKSCITLDGWTL